MNNPKKVLLCFTVLMLVMLVMLGGMNIAPAQTAEQIAEKALAATVYLEMKDQNGVILGFGSGFFVKENLIATNYHVIEGAASGTAKLVGKYTTYTIQGVTATDEANDLALLKVNAYGIKPLPLGDSDNVRIGATVYVAGNPKGLEGTFSNGIISSSHNRHTKKERLQMTAPISPGSSGGAVLNRKGEVIGLSFMTIEGGQNLNFAIPSRLLKVLLARSGTAKPFSQRSQSISAEAYVQLGNMYYDLRDYTDAIANYTKSLKLKPDANIYYNRGKAKFYLWQYDAAIIDYDTAIKIKPDFAPAYCYRGFAKASKGQLFAAITDYDTAIKIKPDDALAYNLRGLAKYNLKQYGAAIADYDIAIRLKPDFVTVYNNRGNAKVELEEYFAAITDYDTAIKIKPDDALAYYNRGFAKYRLKQYSEAITDYDTAIKIKSDDSFAYVERGRVKAKLGQYFAAIADYDTAIKLYPGSPSVYYERGRAKNKLDQHFAAIADYDIAIQLKPDFAEAYVDRGIAKMDLGRSREAKQDLQTALKLVEMTGDMSLKSIIEGGIRILE